jgi:hypothetical protein
MKALDIRKSGSLSIEEAKRFSQLAASISDEYNEFIEDLTFKNNIKGVQYVLQVICRNTYMSKIYDRMCRLSFLEDRLKAGEKYSSVLTDSRSLSGPIEFLLNKYNSKAQIIVDEKIFFSFFIPVYLSLRNLYICLNLWIWPKFFWSKKDPIDDVYFLDTFIFKDSFDNDSNFKDRYYTNLLEKVDFELKEKIWYVPTLHGFRYPWEWIKLLYGVKNSKANILLKENYLKTFDYISAFLNSFTLGSVIKEIPKWRDIDISSIVKEEVFNERGSFSITQSLLIYKFIERVRNKNIKLKGLIDWYENQNIDRALYLGVKEYYPGVKVKGYLGFVPQNYYLGLWPQKFEMDGGVLPDELLVIGDRFIPSINKYLPEMKVSSAPAFRFANPPNLNQKSHKRNIILLAMPMIIDEARNIINIASEASKNSNYRWLIKLHPVTSKKSFQKVIPNSLNSAFEYTNCKVSDLLHNTHLLVTSASSVCLEAIVCETPVTIIGNRSGQTINPLSGVIDQKYWSISYSAGDLLNNIAKTPATFKLESETIFSGVSQKNVKDMMNF